MTPARFEKQIRDGYGPHADAILAVYPHATDVEALKAARDVFRESAFAWHTWAWATLQSERGKGKAFVYLGLCRSTRSHLRCGIRFVGTGQRAASVGNIHPQPAEAASASTRSSSKGRLTVQAVRDAVRITTETLTSVP